MKRKRVKEIGVMGNILAWGSGKHSLRTWPWNKDLNEVRARCVTTGRKNAPVRGSSWHRSPEVGK